MKRLRRKRRGRTRRGERKIENIKREERGSAEINEGVMRRIVVTGPILTAWKRAADRGTAIRNIIDIAQIPKGWRRKWNPKAIARDIRGIVGIMRSIKKRNFERMERLGR